MPPTPPVTFFIHGRAEGSRAYGLARPRNPATTRFKFREPSKLGTALSWMREASMDPDRVLYVLNTGLPGALLAPAWALVQRRRYILDTGDAVYEMAREAGVDAAWKHPFMWLIEQGAHRNARAIVVRGTRHRELLRSRGLRRVEVIRDGYAERFILASRLGEAALMLPELMLLDFEGTVDHQYPRRVADRARLLVQKPDLRELRRSLPNTVRSLCDYSVLSQSLKHLLETLP